MAALFTIARVEAIADKHPSQTWSRHTDSNQLPQEGNSDAGHHMRDPQGHRVEGIELVTERQQCEVLLMRCIETSSPKGTGWKHLGIYRRAIVCWV